MKGGQLTPKYIGSFLTKQWNNYDPKWPWRSATFCVASVNSYCISEMFLLCTSMDIYYTCL